MESLIYKINVVTFRVHNIMYMIYHHKCTDNE